MKNNTNQTLKEIVSFLDEQPGSRPMVIAKNLNITRQYVQKLLAKNKHIFSVTGSGPNRFYRNKLIKRVNGSDTVQATTQTIGDSKLIEDNFYALTPLGEELIGLEGFKTWCETRNLNVNDKQKEYISIIKKYYKKSNDSLIDFSNKLKTTFKDNSLKKVWSIDYYNFEIFGKTKMGTQVMIAKQTGDSQMINELVGRLKQPLNTIITKYDIEAVAFVSPTIQRQSQLMSKLDSNVALQLPRIKVHKVGAKILIAQKTLKGLQDRILNAAETFIVESPRKFENILIIDDALGSGATLNELSKQIIKKNISKNCYGLVLVASPSGYEIINEV